MTRKTFGEMMLVALTTVLLAVPANAGIIGTFGAYTVYDNPIESGIIMFGTGTNPSPFASPVPVTVAGTYPLPPSTVNVGQLQTYLASNGFSNKTAGFIIDTTSGGSATLSLLNIAINEITVVSAVGAFVVPASSHYAFVPLGLNFDSYSPTNGVEFSYAALAGHDNIPQIDLAAAPEPISIALLGTGFVGMVSTRLRKRR